MLVLSRQVGQRIVCDNGVVITLVAIRGNSVKIGIDAPKTVAVDRQEVWLEKRAREPQEKKEGNQ